MPIGGNTLHIFVLDCHRLLCCNAVGGCLAVKAGRQISESQRESGHLFIIFVYDAIKHMLALWPFNVGKGTPP